MKNHWRILLSVLPENIERRFYQRFFLKEHAQWEVSGKRYPASHYSKQNALKDLRNTFSVSVLVETGTYLGDMLYALYNSFDKLYSIELAGFYFARARKRFRKHPKIQLLHGDSSDQLDQLVKNLSAPALFWLDGHYSGGLTAKGAKECPVYEELLAIFKSPFNHVVVIDDARLFTGKNDYPSLPDLKKFIEINKPLYHMSIENDSIRVLPPT